MSEVFPIFGYERHRTGSRRPLGRFITDEPQVPKLTDLHWVLACAASPPPACR
jgi:hypothetical protein